MKIAENAFLFFINEPIVSISRLTSGHIHGSYHVASISGHYVLQHMNEHVFPDIEAVMHNAILLSQHLREQADYPYEVPQFIKTKDGSSFLRNSHGCWRCLTFIGHPSHGAEVLSVEIDPYEVARAFGQFSHIASRLRVDQLRITIPGFHDPTRRWSDYVNALTHAKEDRNQMAEDAIARVEKLAPIRIWALNKGLDQVAHNDPKPSNIITNTDGTPLAIIDFDTVMPGSHYDDFGDLVRSMCCNHDENTDPGQQEIIFETDIYDKIFTGFTDGHHIKRDSNSRSVFQKMSAYIIFEQAIRFLGDYLLGDQYYKVQDPEKNHLRALNQLSLLESMVDRLALSIK